MQYCIGVLGGALGLSACDSGVDGFAISAQLTGKIRTEYANGDIEVCGGYVLSRSEAQLYRRHRLC